MSSIITGRLNDRQTDFTDQLRGTFDIVFYYVYLETHSVHWKVKFRPFLSWICGKITTLKQIWNFHLTLGNCPHIMKCFIWHWAGWKGKIGYMRKCSEGQWPKSQMKNTYFSLTLLITLKLQIFKQVTAQKGGVGEQFSNNHAFFVRTLPFKCVQKC